ncbi:unnamed protein product [Calypogeia fissa]
MAWMVSLIVLCMLKQVLPSLVHTSIDELALKNFRDFVTNDPNDALASWDRNTHVCHWDHVSCNDNKRVISLDLSNQGLVGIISASLGALEFLEHLNLENNSFTGVMPVTLGYLAYLHTSDLGNNNLNGQLPHSIQMIRQTHARSTSTRSLLSVSGQTTTKENNLPLILGVAGGVTIFIVLCISIVLLCRRYRKSKRKDQKLAMKRTSGGLAPATSKKLSKLSERARKSTKSFTVQQLLKATDNFSYKNVIGEGGFGLVYRGTLPSGQEVAIKHAHKDAKQGLEEFYNEVELLSKVHHKYLVDLIGYCDEEGEQLLVYEFIPNGNLFEHLCGQRTPPLTWRQRVHIAICCAKALAHLHEDCTPPIIHRDIKPSNILLDNDLLAKVADFGLSKTGPVGGASHVSTGVKGTPGYLDPYYYLSWHLGAYSDVYSFGVILLQLVASKPAVDQKRMNRGSNYSLIAWAKDCLRQGHFDSIVDPKLRLQGYNRDILMLMVKLGIHCTGEAIKERPTMKVIYQELEHALETLGSLPSVKGSPDTSRESLGDSGELTTESVATLGDPQDEHFHLYSNICFDGRSWVDIKMLGDDQPEEQGQHSEEQGQYHSEGQGQDHPKAPEEHSGDHFEEQGQEHASPKGSSLHASKDSLDISINSPKLEAAKRIS